MVTRQRRRRWLTAAAVGAAVGVTVAAWMAMSGAARMPWDPERASQREARPAAGSATAAAPPASAAIVVETVPISVSTCPPQPVLPVEPARGDGAFALDAALEARPLPSGAAFLAVGREAAAQGRLRDAEVSFIAACRVAERQGGSHSAPVADAKAELGEHYLALAARDNRKDTEGLFRRASTLFSESADAYAVALGKSAARTRMAEQRLAAVRTGTPLEAASRMPPPMQASQDPGVLGAARSGMAGETAARSSARQLISSDPELAQLESDLGRLQAQASRITRDPAGLRSRDAEAAARRDAQCEDKPCLLRWYAQRRSQLLNEF